MTKRNHGEALQRRSAHLIAMTLMIGVLTIVGARTASAAPCDAPVVNAVACENTRPGNPESEWGISGAGSASIQGFATEMSVAQGETIGFKVKTPASSYRLDIYRMGFYGGNGARKITSITPQSVTGQPACLTQPATGLVDCGNWTQNASWPVPANAVSGVYFAKLVRTDGTAGASHVYFVVRNDNGNSDLLFQTSDTTWQAYNRYGGNSLYTGSPAGRAYKVSYNRPLTIGDYAPEDSVFNSEYPMVRFLESNGYDVSYTSGVDTDRRGAELLEHKVFLSVGHDEYWSGQQRANVEAARDAGVNLAFFSGNEVFWKTRWENSIDASGRSHRTLVSYKETSANRVIDPAAPTWTGTWRDPRFSPPGDGGRPENALTGQIFTVNCCATDMVVGAADGDMRFWRNTRVADLSGSQTATVGSEIVGYEWDEDLDNGARPDGLFRVSQTRASGDVIQDYGSTYAPGSATHSMTIYRHASGALVFGAGTVQWSWGLDSKHVRGGPSTADSAAQQATVNLFADMGVQPATLVGGLTPAVRSSDVVAPTSTITSPTAGETAPAGTDVTVTGTATDSGGRVGGVEVSTDDGATWRRAIGRSSWSYTFNTGPDEGPLTIRVRATDDSANIESPGAGVTIEVGGDVECPCSIWPDSTTPSISSDGSAVELGVKFRTSVAGTITGVRFYKGSGNTGTHVGSLWTASGTNLGRVTFTGESASGWQQATFASPVAVKADTTYVVSYHAPNGRYALAEGGLSSGVTRGVLSVPGSDAAGGNGVYAYGSGGFPSNSYGRSNYFVDVVFEQGGATDTTKPTVTTRNPAAGASGVGVATKVSATFSEPVTASSVQVTVAPAGGSAVAASSAYDAASRTVTLTPAAVLANSKQYTVTVSGATDAAGNTMAPVSWTFTTAAPPGPSGCPCSIWPDSTTPSISSDGSAVELGVKFRTSVAGTITGVRFYKGSGNTGTHVGSLWTASGTNLGRVTFTGESASGWQQATFASPVAVQADTTYVVSYHAPNGRYALAEGGLSSGVTRGVLSVPGSDAAGGNGVYAYGSGGFPSNSYGRSNYFVDVVFEQGGATDTTKPTVTTRNPAAGASGVGVATKVSATFSEPVTASSVQVTVAPAGGSAVAASSAYDAASRTVTLTPAAVLANSKQYTVTLSGAADPAGNVMAPVSWTFTTAAAGDTTAPVVTARTPTPGATGVANSSNVTATFDEPVTAASIRIAVAPSGGPAVAGAVAYNATNRTVTLDPTAALANSKQYTVTLSGAADAAGNTMAPVSWTFTTAAPPGPSGCPCSIWPDSTTPSISSDGSAVELGVKFRTSVAGMITGVRFYKGSGNTGTHVGSLWTASGTNLGRVTFTGESASGWQQATFASPVAVQADTTYVVSYHAPNGRYALAEGGLSSGVTRGVLSVPGSDAAGGNGVYAYGSGGFPSNSYGRSNYFVDVVFEQGGATDTTKPTVTTRNPAAGASGVGVATTVSARFSEPVTAASVQIALAPTGGAAVAASAGYDENSRTVTLTPTATLAADTGYTVSLSGATDASGNVMAPVTWTFRTAAPSGCPCSIWPASTTPPTAAATDTSAVELGVKFRTAQAGFVTGIRFYKGAGNGGTHVGTLWSSSGTELATVTFTGETASGWQEARFSAPVAVEPATTYVASYHAPQGRYALRSGGLASAVSNGPLTALASGSTGGNGVYAYGGRQFPSNTFGSSNYFVDLVYETSAVDTTPPAVVTRAPADGATNASVSAPVQASFGEAVVGTTVNMALVGPGSTSVTGTVAYDAGSRTASFTPATALAFSTAYTVTVSGARDQAGNTMAATSWSFTTAGPPPPLPTDGPGGPIGVVTSGTDSFSGYFAEILRAEGLNEFTTVDVGDLDTAALADFDTVVLGRVQLSAQQVSQLTAWVQAGGNLVASRPDPKLAPLLGLSPVSGTLSTGYIGVDGATAAGGGITADTMQFHGPADRYTLSGASAVATLYSTATTATSNPAVTVRSVGSNGGQAAAFTYDLARSVVYTRQGNPAWEGQERDNADAITRSNDLFFGGAEDDWVDLDKVAIPQADEQQRLFANLIEVVNRDVMPLPRFWYFPDDHEAVVVATGDDHATGGTPGRFDTYRAADPAGCSTSDWECNRFSSYIYPNTPLSDSAAAAYDAQDFEIGVHPENGCRNFGSIEDLRSTYTSRLGAWAQSFPSLPSPVSNRMHCLVWSDWASQAAVEAENGMRLDVNYYYWPGSWVNDRPGFMTGSGMPQRFARTDGTMIDVYQAATQMTDESGQSYPFTPDTLLDLALGSKGYYGYFVANMHTDQPTTQQDAALLSSATSRGVPVVSARDVLEFVDGRNQSSFRDLTWSGNQLSFGIAAAGGANGLTAMLPTTGPGGTMLNAVRRGGANVAYSTKSVKGIDYAMFAAVDGSYTATYGAPGGPAQAQATRAIVEPDGTASIEFTTAAPTSSQVVYGTSPDALDSSVQRGGAVGEHVVTIDDLDADETYFYRVVVENVDGSEATWPDPGDAPATFRTEPEDRTAPVVSDLSIEPRSDGTASITWRTDEPSDSTVRFARDSADAVEARGAEAVTDHEVVLTALEAGERYDVRAVSNDAAGNESDDSGAVGAFSAERAGVSEYMAASQRVGDTTGGVRIVEDDEGRGTITLQPDATPSGTFTSRVLDARQQVNWTAVTWEGDAPDGTELVVSVRGGNSADPDASWSDWQTVQSPGDRIDLASRFVQYRVAMQSGPRTTDPPRLSSVSFTHDADFPVTEGEVEPD